MVNSLGSAFQWESGSRCTRRLRASSLYALLAVIAGVSLLSCSDDATLLAPYEAHRPLKLLRITQNVTPDVQWVGGRVAALGVNRGETAALDSTLVWMMRAEDDDIESYITVGSGGDDAAVGQYGGTAVDQLTDGETYTIWLATREAMEGNLAAGSRTPFTFIDTTMTFALNLRGLSRGAVDVDLVVTRSETLLDGMRYIINWTPSDVAFRRIGINHGAASGSFANLIWHVVLEDDDAPDSILPPVIIGETPPGAVEATPWPGDFAHGEDAVNNFLWMVNSDWNGSFAGLRPPGMAALLVQRANFLTEP